MRKWWRSGLRARRLVPALFWVLVALLAAFVIFVQFLTTSGSGSTAVDITPTPPVPSPTPALPPSPTPIVYPQPQRLTPATVVAVVDGDTIEVLLPGERKSATVRYYGINARERGQRCYQEATRRNQELVGEAVLLLPDARDKDRHGRLLRYVFGEDGTSIDSLLVAEGLAEAWREDGSFRAELIEIEEAARALELGCLWRREGR
ncbi:MAG: thermonuclease family protein [Dehalococcoidia bacterium]